MTQALHLSDRAALDDLGTFAGRARTLDADGALRLQAVGSVLAAWVCALPGHGLFGDGTVLGLRTFALDTPATLDATVPIAAVLDRTARASGEGEFPVPPTRAFPQWAALTPPRSGWGPSGQIDADLLVAAATEGIEEIGQGAGPGSGALAVTELRKRVWGRALPDSTESGGEVCRGAGFAAYALGFLLPEAQVPVHRSGPWTRLTCPGGYVLIR